MKKTIQIVVTCVVIIIVLIVSFIVFTRRGPIPPVEETTQQITPIPPGVTSCTTSDCLKGA